MTRRQAVWPAALAALVFAVGAVLVADGLGWRLVDRWGALPNGKAWGEVSGVVVTPDDRVIALRRDDPPLVELTPAGRVQRVWGEGLFEWPHGFRLDADGFLWVTDGRAGDGRGQQVFKIAPDGRIVLRLGQAGVSGEGPDTFNGPADVAFGPNGEIFVADGHRNNRIVKFSKDGTFLKTWGHAGDGPGEFNVPHAIATDSRGRLFVADRGNSRVQIFDQDGVFLEAWTQFGRPSGILITADDTLYVADVQDKRGIVVGSAKDGSVRGVIEGTLPESVALDRAGSIYAGETTTGRTLRKFIRS
jgi:sugar lactone lactonase YvrE